MKSKSKPEIAEGAETRRLRQPLRGDPSGLTNAIIGAAIEVHRHLGPGLLESAYEECLCYELSQVGLAFRRQVRVPVRYKGLKLDCDFRLDLLVEESVIVEIKTVDQLAQIHSAQLITYLKATNRHLGLLINFNVPVLKNGIERVVNHYVEPEAKTDVSAPSAAEPGERDAPDAPVASLRFSPRLGVSAVNRRPH